MPRYEYKVVPAPSKGTKAKGVRGAEARFSNALQELMNGLAGDGWEYQRAETLPSVERAGLTGSTTEWRNVLVFRRLRGNDADAFQPELLPAPDPVMPGAQQPDGSGPVVVATSGTVTTAKVSKSSIHTDVEWDIGGDAADAEDSLSGPLSVLAEFRSPKEKAAEAAKEKSEKDKSKSDKSDA